MPPERDVAVTSWNVHLPGADLGDRRLAALLPAGALPADQAHELLGRRGLLVKDPATRLALCSVHLAVEDGAPRAARRPVDERTAVVVASNAGNLEAVAHIARTAGRRGGRAVSPLEAPNASSNVIASSIAIRFGWGAPNITITSGATAGLDAVSVGLGLLAARRADRVVVAGVEPDDEVAVAVRAAGAPRSGTRPRAVAATVVLEPAGRGPETRPVIGDVAVARPDDGPPSAAPVDLQLGPPGVPAAGGRQISVEPGLGDAGGATGVLQVALAARLLTEERARSIRVVCGSARDGWRWTTCRRTDVMSEVT